MDVNKRLDKLEKAANLHSEFCMCLDTNRTFVIQPDLTRTKAEHDRLIAEAEAPRACERCKKPVNAQVIVIEYVKDWRSIGLDGVINDTVFEL